MKKLFTILLMVGCVVPSFSQKDTTAEIRTIFKEINPKQHGGYGGFSVLYSTINAKDSYITGWRGAWIMNHRFALGGGVYSIETEAEYNSYMQGKQKFSGGYGGIMIEPIIFPKSVIHVSLPIMFGAGGIGCRLENTERSNTDKWRTVDKDIFFVIEPGIELETNVVKFLRIGIGIYYRYTSAVELIYEQKELGLILDNKKFLNNYTAGICFKFGKF